MTATPATENDQRLQLSAAIRSRVVYCLAAGRLVLHLLTANRYGIFRDEMYGIACAQHLDWGYPDHPPGGIVIAWIAGRLFGDSLLGLRLLPALAGAALVVLTGGLTREMGGRAFAQILAALAACVAPMYLIFDHWLMMNAFEPLIWIGCAYCVIRVIDSGEGRYWLGFGVLAGLGLETKYSILFLIIGVLIGLMLTPQRGRLADWQLWIGLLACAAIALPNFLWQLRHGFPFLELRHNIAAGNRDIIRGPFAFLGDQMLIMGPLAAPLLIGGAVWLLGGRQRRRYGVLGWAFLFVLGAFIALKGKNYYVTPVYPIAFAAGAIAFEEMTERAGLKWVRTVYTSLVAVSGVVLLPTVVPILSPETLLSYEKWLRLEPPVVFERQNNGPLPQYFADEFGWEDLVREVARVYHSLSPADQKRTTIFSNGWGEAAAVDYYGPKYGLPRAICRQNSYWYWGPGGNTFEIAIILRTDGRGDRPFFASVEKVGHVQNPYSRRDEWFDIYLCRGRKFDVHKLWPTLKRLD